MSLKHLGEILELVEKVDSVLIGPGVGVNDETSKLLNSLVVKINKPLVLDADSLKQVDVSLVKNKDNIVLTPHLAEFNNFFSTDLKLNIDSYDFEEIDNVITGFQRVIGQINGCVVVKGRNDLILSGKRFRINKSGNAGMTVGGTGDVLAGVIVTLMSQGIGVFDAACLGVFINGLAGDGAFNDLGYGFCASDVIGYIGTVIKNGLC